MPSRLTRLGLVVTPSRIPQRCTVRISSRFAVSRKNFIAVSPSRSLSRGFNVSDVAHVADFQEQERIAGLQILQVRDGIIAIHRIRSSHAECALSFVQLFYHHKGRRAHAK